MEFGFTADEAAFRAEVRSFLEEEWEGSEVAGHAWSVAYDREIAFRRKLGERGWLTLGWPGEPRERPVGRMDRYILSQETTRVGAPFPSYVANVIGPLIVKNGSDELKNELLPRLRTGNVNFVLGFTEPDTGSDLANLSTVAVREGDGFVVNGQKMYGRPEPGDVMFLAVRTDPEAPIRKGISILLVDFPSPGMTAATMDSLASTRVGATYYTDVFVPRHRLLGEENGGWSLIREAMDLDRSAGIAYGHLPRLFELVLDYATTHKRDGARLADQPAVRDTIARLAVDLEAALVIQDIAASKTASGLDLHTEAAALKVFCTEFEARLTNFAVELTEAAGSVTDTTAGLHPLVRAASNAQRANVAITIAGGSNEIQRNIIATQGLGLPRDA